ncbi:WcaF family extracellular polysaccharide biosynthesis acetyltransferase [Autumnicola psychrophila]|uniref:WcaF family extracellular polysaccharide biosynthesis acetyltransferase n=1 Tax=Autumnicola psychrophila TaxID=3075592 RepID=A0ABU3DNG1_9FLAO|nr:WcaF family extracellular polysaccharide biosynthesis acetyltransferase [Zunongwangia sp. F225]MDT0685246.1 WcaF family extracellular polysaccharide biosynthesis acetyltransferase [Zunongwangia sp. F225]
MKTDLSKYDNSWYQPGGRIKILLWYFTNVLFFQNTLNPSSGSKVALLKLFGAKIGQGVVIKPGVNIKYPWKLEIGMNTWIGEKVWIDNLEMVKIGKNVCLSQGAMLLCGNHNYKKSSFDLIIKEINLEDGVWIGAQSIVCPGVICKSHSILAVSSVANKDLEPYLVYQGNPAVEVRERVIGDDEIASSAAASSQ